MDLNLRQSAFVKYYLKSGNATQAAIAAGYAAGCAHVTGFHLLRHPKIRKALKRVAEKTQWDQARVILKAEELLEMAVRKEDVAGGRGVLQLITTVLGLQTEARHNPQNDARDLNDADLANAIAEALGRAGAGAGAALGGPPGPDRVH
jgi:phage terminase small subunit